MLTISILLNGLESSILRSHISNKDLSAVVGIMMLDEDCALSENAVYIGTCDTVLSILDNSSGEQRLNLLCAGDSEELRGASIPEEINLTVFSLSTAKLYNSIYSSLCSYQNWISNLNAAHHLNDGLQKLVEEGFKKIKQPIVVLNSGFKMLASVIPDNYNDPLMDEVRTKGFFAYETVCAIVDEQHSTTLLRKSGPDIEYISKITGNRTFVRFIRHNGNIVAYVIVTLEGYETDEYFEALSTDICDHIQSFLEGSEMLNYIASTEINTIITDLIELRLTEPSELEQRLKLLPSMVIGKYYHPVVMSFAKQSNEIPWNFVINQMDQIFSKSNITVYKGALVILINKAHLNSPLPFDKEKLTALLEHYDAFIALGRYSMFLTSLRPLYLQAVATIRLGKVFRKDPHERIFNYEDYNMYHMVELCIEASFNSYQFSNLSYLCHPAVFGIARYDEKHGTNLKETLNTYLNTNCNATQSAKLLYVHRNTINYKIDLIEKIIGRSLNDRQFQEQLMFSFYVFEYEEKYLRENPLDIKNRGNKEFHPSIFAINK